jgi:hypothetical protein
MCVRLREAMQPCLCMYCLQQTITDLHSAWHWTNSQSTRIRGCFRLNKLSC